MVVVGGGGVWGGSRGRGRETKKFQLLGGTSG